MISFKHCILYISNILIDNISIYLNTEIFVHFVSESSGTVIKIKVIYAKRKLSSVIESVNCKFCSETTMIVVVIVQFEIKYVN